MKNRTSITIAVLAAIAVIVVGIGVIVYGRSTPKSTAHTESMSAGSMHNESTLANLKAQSGDAYDQLFLTMMSEHHAGAIAMAKYVLNDAKHPEIRTLAAGIIAAQTKELTEMKSWASAWGYAYTAPSQKIIDENIVSFKGKTGDALDKQFLTDMLGHHQGALDMATLSATRAKHAEIKTLSDNIISTQTNEIAHMKGYASTFGYQNLDSADDYMHSMHM